MMGRRYRLWRYSALALWLALCAADAAGTKAAQTLPSIAKPFAAPDFELKGEDGNYYRLSDYRGKVVVLNFWATWCPPCRYEMPSLERAHQKLKGENIAVLAINVGEDENTVFAFTGHYPVTFPLPLDIDGKVIQKYPVVGLPTTYIVDPSGYVTHRAVGSREWDDEQLLGQLRKLLKP